MISFGLGDNWKFENELVKSGQVKSFIVFDHTQSLSNFINQVFHKIKFHNFNLSLFMGRIIVLGRYFRDFIIYKKKHIKRKISRNGSGFFKHLESLEASVPEIFDRYVRSEDQIIFLKIDIEGSEYEIIDQIFAFSNQIIVIVIEFHDIIKKSTEFKHLLDLLKSKYSLIHTHINNNGVISTDEIPEVCEFTFYSKKEFETSLKVDKIPSHELDQPNNKHRKDFQIDFKTE